MHKQWIVRFILTSVLYSTAWACAETPAASDQGLTLSQAYQLALANNLQIKAIEKRLGEADAQVLLAKIRMNPTFVSDLGLVAEKTYRVGGLQQTFEAPGRRHYRIEVAKDKRDAIQADVKHDIYRVLADVRAAYSQWLSAVVRLDFLQKNQQILEQINSLCQQTHAIAVDQTQADMMLQLAIAQTLKAQQELCVAQTTLQSLLQEKTLHEPSFSQGLQHDVIQLPALDVLTDKVLNNRWDLKENAAELKAQADRIRLFHHSIFPNITLTAGYDLVEQGSHGVSGVFVMGSFPLPIFDHQQGNLAASKATQARLLSERVALEESIRRQIILQYQKLQASQIEWNQVKTQLIPLADQADQLALKDFSAGKSHLGDVLGQHQNAFSVQLASMDSYIRYQQALNDLEALLRDGINVAGLENNSEDTMDPDEDIPIEHSDDG